jgi:alpha-beta hydrolase superfamily lysophospholipase
LERFPLAAADGFALSAMRWLPSRSPRAVLVVSHGMAEYAARYAPFAEACSTAGIAVYAHDHRGHGGSVDDATPRGHFADGDGWSKVRDDLERACEHARAAHPGAPVFLLGHSMGSFVARAHIVEHGEGLAGAILSATGWRLGAGNRMLASLARRQARKLGPRAPSPLMSKVVFGTFNLRFLPARTGFDWLSRDRGTVDAYIADPGCGFACSGQLWADLMSGVDALERAENEPARLPRSLPILLIAGSHDPVSMGGFGNEQLARRYRAAGNEHVLVRRYPRGRHELLNETNRAEVFADLLAWLDSRMGR